MVLRFCAQSIQFVSSNAMALLVLCRQAFVKSAVLVCLTFFRVGRAIHTLDPVGCGRYTWVSDSAEGQQ